jgi:hypothetical protein
MATSLNVADKRRVSVRGGFEGKKKRREKKAREEKQDPR